MKALPVLLVTDLVSIIAIVMLVDVFAGVSSKQASRFL
jgi:hypothetical protein